MPRAGLSTAAVVDAALGIVDEHGVDGLTLAAVAARTGVAAPSLYKHVRSLAELRSLIGERVIEEMTERFSSGIMGCGGDDAVTILMRAYRAYAVQYPRRYAAMPFDVLHDPALAAAGEKLLKVFLAVLRGYGMTDSAAIHAARRLRALVHGFAAIEVNHGFALPEDLDESYEQAIAMYVASLPKS